ncbi:MAG: hypothetical protein AB1512_15450 [Thermodesulfobacteriota bacterium]
MESYRIQTTVSSEGTVVLEGLPFRPGEEVEVVVQNLRPEPAGNNRYPLRGKPIRYTAPFESISEEDWDVLK